MARRQRSQYALAELEIFADSPRVEVEAASVLLSLVTLEGGKVLMRERSVGLEFLIIAEGLVGVTKEDGPEVVAMMGPGEVLGEMALLHGAPRSATATTLSPTTVYAASRREFFALLRAAPTAASRIVDLAAARLLANQAA